MADVAQRHAGACSVDDDSEVQVNGDRPEIGVFRACDPVQTMARLDRIELQAKGGGLGRPLVLFGEPGRAGNEGIGYARLH